MGNSNKTFSMILFISSIRICATFTFSTGTIYFSSSSSFNLIVSFAKGFVEFNMIIKGFFIDLSSFTTRFSASIYSSRWISVILPSVVTSNPIVECSFITFLVPNSAASSKGI